MGARIFALLLILLTAGGLRAQEAFTVETVPDPKNGGTGYVSDPGDVLSAAEEQQLNQLIASLEDSSTAQIAVVVLPSIGEENPKDFATRLFAHWGIGQAGKDNGLLILAVLDQRRTEFETGYGLEGVLPDAIVYRVGMQELVPFFQQGQFGQGLIAAVSRFKEILEDPSSIEEISAEPVGSSGDSGDGWWFVLGIYGTLNLLYHLGLLVWIWRSLRGKEDLYDRYQSLWKIKGVGALIFFPLPYVLVFLYLTQELRRLRNQPRFSKLNGKPMRRLLEEEEDAYLVQGQITEEDIGSVDYDVWVTDDADDILILRYARKHSRYRDCPECKFRTFYHASTTTIKQATYSSSGKQEVLFLCKNCNYRKQQFITIPKKQMSSGSSSSGGSSRSSGSSSWGGGRSGGGGSGVSW